MVSAITNTCLTGEALVFGVVVGVELGVVDVVVVCVVVGAVVVGCDSVELGCGAAGAGAAGVGVGCAVGCGAGAAFWRAGAGPAAWITVGRVRSAASAAV